MLTNVSVNIINNLEKFYNIICFYLKSKPIVDMNIEMYTDYTDFL